MRVNPLVLMLLKNAASDVRFIYALAQELVLIDASNVFEDNEPAATQSPVVRLAPQSCKRAS